MLDPAGDEAGDGPVGGHRAVVGGGQHAVDELLADGGDRVDEGLLVEHPGVPGRQPPAQPLQPGARAAGPPRRARARRGRRASARSLQPRAELPRDGGELQHPGAVEVLDVVQGVGDVVGQVHHRALERLPARRAGRGRPRAPPASRAGRSGSRRTWPRRAPPPCPAPRGGSGQSSGAGRGGAKRAHGYLRTAARTAAVRLRPSSPGPVHLQLGEDPEGLGVALEAVGQPEAVPGQPVQGPLAEVAEGRVAEVVGVGRGLDDDVVQPAEARAAGRGPRCAAAGRRWRGRPRSP